MNDFINALKSDDEFLVIFCLIYSFEREGFDARIDKCKIMFSQNHFKATKISKIMSKIAERLLRTGIYTMSEEVASMIKEAAYKLNIDLKRADLKRTRDILKRGEPLSRIVVEMREMKRVYLDTSAYLKELSLETGEQFPTF